MKRPEGISQRFRSRERIFGAWTSLGHPSITEIFASIGVDFIGIDLEHSTIGLEEAQRIIAAAQAGGVACLPRLSGHQEEQARRLLDSGADGLIVPNVSSMVEIDRIVDWCKYPPMGKRGYGIARAQRYGFDFDRYVRSWNQRSVILIQIESIQAANGIEKLLANEAVDGVMIGPYDLSGSLGVPGQLKHPKVVEAGSHVMEACRQRDKACGIQLVDPTAEEVSASLEFGYTFVVLASDVFILWKWSDGMRRLVLSVPFPSAAGR